MKILTIHGYKGNAHNAVYSALHSLGVDTISPQFDYNKDSPEYVFAELRKILDENQVDMITGTSLGGFFALALAIERDLPVMLTNPCLMPFLHLPRLGYTGEVDTFMKVFPIFTKVDTSKAYAVIGEKDQIIDTHDFTKRIIPNYDVVEGADHFSRNLNLEYYFKKELEKGGYI